LDEVKGVVLSYGVYDMMITIETENIEELDNLVFNEIRKIEGIVSTTTLIGAGKKVHRYRFNVDLREMPRSLILTSWGSSFLPQTAQ
jgi:DNA-binding Lrp family transcriptional regulator